MSKQKNTNKTGYKGKYYDPNFKENKAKYGDKYDPKKFGVLNPDWEPPKYNNRRNNNNYQGKRNKRNNGAGLVNIVVLVITLFFLYQAATSLNLISDFLPHKNNSASNTENIVEATDTNTAVDTSDSTDTITPDIGSLMNNTSISVDSCDTSGSRQPNVKVDVGYDFREYYGYTNEYSQLVYVHADQLTEQYKSEENSDNRYCDAQANVEGAEGAYNRGHAIGDALGGDSNAYNIFPQLSDINGGEYNEIEKKLQDTLRNGGSVTDFNVELTYPNSSTNIPSSYIMSFNLNGTYEQHEFTN